MKLYRIKRLRDGRRLTIGSDWPNCDWRGGDRGQFFPEGAFWRTPEAIKHHLYNLCCDWKNVADHRYDDFYHKKRIAGPFWERLDLYVVEILVVLDSETIKQPAKDFMGILEDA